MLDWKKARLHPNLPCQQVACMGLEGPAHYKVFPNAKEGKCQTVSVIFNL